MDVKFDTKESPKKVIFCVDGVRCAVAGTLSAGDFMRIAEFCENKRSNYRELIVEIVHSKIHTEDGKTSLSVDQIMTLPDSIFDEYIMAVLERNKEFKEPYSQLSEISDPYERFAKAITKYAADNIAQALKSIDYGPAMEKLAEQRRQFQEVTEKVIGPALRSIAQYTKNLVEASIGPITTALKKLGEFALQIKTPSLTEAEKQALLESYQKWGEYGWTMAPEMLIGFFDAPPMDRKSANREALKFCTNRDMEELFEKLRSMEGIKQSDLEEAVFDFKHGKYKSCIMVLYSMIDAKFIRLQKDEDRKKNRRDPQGKGRRRTGEAAGKIVINRLQNLPSEKHNFYVALICNNLLACMGELFKDGNDFVEQPQEANRNFLDHGMLTRSVKRMDCVKVFLFYYNLIQLLNWKI